MATGQFCLKWNNFHNSIVTAFESLQSTEELVDVTLMCEGRNVKAHKVILSACSPYFRNLFKETPCKHPIIILKDVLYCDLVAILQFMYQGEVLVDQDGLASFLKTAELLQVSGLAGSSSSAAAAGIPEELNNIPPSSVPSNKISVPLTTKPETLCPARTKTPPSSPKPPPLVKVRNDIIPLIEPSVIEKENIILTREEPEDEPMQSCSYQATENVIIKTESADDQDYHELDYLDPMDDDPGSTTTEEQSILERSLKAQGMSPHSTKLYSMDYPNQSQSQSTISINPPELATLNKNNIEIVDCGKRKLMKSSATEAAAPAAKKLLVKTILPKVELKTVKCSDALHVTSKSDHHGAQIGNCPHCSKMYSNQSALKYHVRLVHSDMLNMFCCHLCPESFEFRESYKTHMWDKHNVRN